ncbi:MAG: hypothetical protein NUV84_05175 [Candidatus Uhrbacteria bacterium]|nr:hypothetical protein [Candidatus Uhrbacteria bacterium]
MDDLHFEEADDPEVLREALVHHDETHNMQHLNIPLKRHTKTTRPMRQVVWLLVGLLVVTGFLAYRAGALWFNQGKILSMAPSDTIIAVELQLNERTAPFLLDWLAGVPLLSDRSLELRDLAPYVHGDLAVFVTKDGGRSVAIRSDESDLPTKLLSQFSITSQIQEPFVLLSPTLVPMTGTTSFMSPLLPSIGRTWLGRVVLPQDGLAGNLFISTTSLTLGVETNKRVTGENRAIPEATIALGGLSWGEEGSVLPGLGQILSERSLILENTGSIEVAVVPAESGLEILLKIEAPEATSEDLIRELEQIGAFARPTIASQILPDGTQLEEILVQPELVSVEEISTNIGVSYRVPVGGGVYILAALHKGSVLFSNSQTLLERYAEETKGEEGTNCPEFSNRMNPAFLIEQTSLNHMQPQFGLLSEVFDDFSAISFEFKKYSTVVHLCRI